MNSKAARKMYDSNLNDKCENKENTDCCLEVAALKEDVKYLKENLNKCLEMLENVALNLAQTVVMLNRLFDIEHKKSRFPIKTIEDLTLINEEIFVEKDKFLKLFKDIAQNKSIRKTLPILLAEPLLLELNFDGRCNKRSFKEFEHVSGILFECYKSDTYPYEKYIEDMRKAFKQIKGRHYKNESLKKKSQKHNSK